MTAKTHFDPPRVTLHLGVTLPGAQQFSSVRADVEVSNLEVGPEFEADLERALALVSLASPSVQEALAQRVADASGLAVEGVGLAAEFSLFKERLTRWQSNVVEEVKRQRELLEERFSATDK